MCQKKSGKSAHPTVYSFKKYFHNQHKTIRIRNNILYTVYTHEVASNYWLNGLLVKTSNKVIWLHWLTSQNIYEIFIQQTILVYVCKDYLIIRNVLVTDCWSSLMTGQKSQLWNTKLSTWIFKKMFFNLSNHEKCSISLFLSLSLVLETFLTRGHWHIQFHQVFCVATFMRKRKTWVITSSVFSKPSLTGRHLQCL